MQKEISKEDAWLALEFAMLYDFASNANQADDEKQIKLVRLGSQNRCRKDIEDARRRNFDIIAVALGKGYSAYEDLPQGTKSFISICANIAKNNKKKSPQLVKSFLQIVREEYSWRFGGLTQSCFFD